MKDKDAFEDIDWIFDWRSARQVNQLLRGHIAALALQGMLASGQDEDVVWRAVKYADALMKELEP